MNSGNVAVKIESVVDFVEPARFDRVDRVVESLDGAFAAQYPDEVCRF